MAQVDSETSTAVSGATPDKQHHGAPESPQDALYLPTDTTPEQLFQAIGALRKEARDEIDRLLQFLDKTDDYVSRELEDQVDDGPCDDNELDCPENGEDEESEPDEPSLGCSNPSQHHSQALWSGYGGTTLAVVDLEDEHDGGEPEDEGGDGAKEDDEPSLGWTVDGRITNSPHADCDFEEGIGTRPPQDRTVVASNVAEETGYPNRLRRDFAVKRTDRPSDGRGCCRLN